MNHVAKHAAPPPDENATFTPAPGVDLKPFVFALFFIFGGITSLNDVIIPKLKGLFQLSYAEAMLVQSAFFTAYLLVSMPAAAIVRRFGYLRSAAIGLVTMMVGCLLFVPASASGAFAVFLGALFVLAGGITIVQVVANPLISLLGPPQTAHSRLTFAQAFNSLGTTIFPYVGSILILGALPPTAKSTLSGAALTAYRAAETSVVVRTYLGLAAALLIVALVVWAGRRRLQETPAQLSSILKALDLLKQPRFGFGAACIFLYVGAEVAIGSIIVNYLIQPSVLALGEQAAGKHVPFYWGGALIGRFVGAGVLRRVSPGLVLAATASGAVALILLTANTVGPVSAWSLLAIGLCNSIMFPTIFTLASAGLGPRTAEGSGWLCVAIFGGAVIPPLTGRFADIAGLRVALALPALCYLVVLAYGLWTGLGRRQSAAPEVFSEPAGF